MSTKVKKAKKTDTKNWFEADVYGLITHADSVKSEVVILKSKAIRNCINDGMSEEDAEEFYDYNIAGAYGDGSYSCVDDDLDPETLQSMVDEDPSISVPPVSGRLHRKHLLNDLLLVLDDESMSKQKKLDTLRSNIMARM